jgi:hypothetical protein
LQHLGVRLRAGWDWRPEPSPTVLNLHFQAAALCFPLERLQHGHVLSLNLSTELRLKRSGYRFNQRLVEVLAFKLGQPLALATANYDQYAVDLDPPQRWFGAPGPQTTTTG